MDPDYLSRFKEILEKSSTFQYLQILQYLPVMIYSLFDNICLSMAKNV